MTQREMATEREKDRQSEIKREEERERDRERDKKRGRERDSLGDEEKLRAQLFDAFDATDSLHICSSIL